MMAKTPAIIPLKNDWRHIDSVIRDTAWQMIQASINWTPEQLGNVPNSVDIRPSVRQICEARLNDRWKHFKIKLKKTYYDPFKHLQRPIICGDPTIPPDQWTNLVNTWDSEEYEALCERNKKNRQEMDMSHTAGTKSYAAHRDAYFQKHGYYPDDMLFFKITHTRLDATWVDLSSQQHMVNMEAIIAELPPETQQTPAVIVEVFDKEFGDRHGHGRVFGRGLGVRPHDVRSSASSSGRQTRSQQVEAMLAAREEAIRSQVATSLREELSAGFRSEMNAIIAEKEDTMRAQIREEVMADMRAQIRQEVMADMRQAFKEDYYQQLRMPWQSFTQTLQGLDSTHGPTIDFIGTPSMPPPMPPSMPIQDPRQDVTGL